MQASDQILPTVRHSHFRRLTWRSLFLGAFVLLTLIGIVALRSSRTQLPDSMASDRRLALLQASELLFTPSSRAGVRSSGMVTGVNYAPPVGKPRGDAQGYPPGSAGGAVATDDARAPGAPGSALIAPSPEITLLPRTPAAGPGGGPAAPLPASPASSIGKADPHQVPARISKRGALRLAIPSTIEDGEPAKNSEDALSGLTIHGEIRLREGTDCPFELTAAQTDGMRPRVLLRRSPASGGSRGDSEWLTVGQSPAPGWYVMAIDSLGVVLTGPQGGSVRLNAKSVGLDRGNGPAPRASDARAPGPPP